MDSVIAGMRAAEDAILGMANEVGKFAIAMSAALTASQQLALERLQLSGRVRLIDVSTLANAPAGLYRVFHVRPPDA